MDQEPVERLLAEEAPPERGLTLKRSDASPLSQLGFSYLDPLFKKGVRTPLQLEDCIHLEDADKPEAVAKIFSNAWVQEQAAHREGGASLFRALSSAFGSSFYPVGIWKFIYDISQFALPFFVNFVVVFIGNPLQPLRLGALYALALFLIPLVSTLCLHAYFYRVFSISLKIRACLTSVLYDKGLRLASFAKQRSSVGEIVNHMSVDIGRIADVVPYLHLAWSAALQIIVTLSLLFWLLGPAVLAGLAVMITLAPINWVIGTKQREAEEKLLEKKDQRLKITTELLQGIRLVKTFAWERPFLTRIARIRLEEMRWIKKVAIFECLSTFFWTASPGMVTAATFSVTGLLGHKLELGTVFMALSLFAILNMPISGIPWLVTGSIAAKVSLGRIAEFLQTGEVENYVKLEPAVSALPASSQFALGGDKSIAVEIYQGAFSWDARGPQAREIISRMDLRVPAGSLCVLVGKVAAGKSTLLTALLGEPTRLSGDVTVRGTIAYCAQSPWIQNASLRDNILFGRPFDKNRFAAVLRACALERDIELFPGGLDCEIGERGINLSGGQKHRVSLARAVYRDADVYILDDPLSAVDVHVGKHIFEECIRGLLFRKTVILTTHQPYVLPFADQVCVMEEGKLAAAATYQKLLEQGLNFAAIMQSHAESHAKAAAAARGDADVDTTEKSPALPGSAPTLIEGIELVAPAAAASDSKAGTLVEEAKKKVADGGESKAKVGSLITTEERQTGAVKWSIYQEYVKTAGVAVFVFVLTCGIGNQGGNMFGNWWLSIWTPHLGEKVSVPGELPGHFYLGVYLTTMFLVTALSFLQAILVALGGVTAASSFQMRTLTAVLRAPLSIFDTTPVGRILNRFSNDQETLDTQLPSSILDFLSCILYICVVTVVVLIATPLFIVPLIPIGALYYYIQWLYRGSSREVKRLESISRSPLFSDFAETLAGAHTVRAFKDEQRFVLRNYGLQEQSIRTSLTNISCNRWLGLRVDFVGALAVSFVALMCAFTRGWTSAGLAGLAISQAISMSGALAWAVRSGTLMETQMNSVERIVSLLQMPTEADLLTYVPRGWPAQGALSFENVSVRYRSNLPYVLRGLSLSIRPREKVGIVGRTGAGKSTLLGTLLRLTEVSEGCILIDGVDVATLGLETLRRSIAVIPQEPTLFSGTLRENLDPFGEHNDEAVWNVLRRARLHESLQSVEGGLSATVAENGDNFSVGQRQLLCLARALLRQCKIVVLDEATASVDVETDALIQRLIREEMKEQTVLTIAHRLETVLDYDRIVVMQEGQVAETDSPGALMRNPNSVFASMTRSLGARASTTGSKPLADL